MIIELLLGIALAATVFAAVLWCGYWAVIGRGARRWANAATAVCTVAGMATISMGAPGLAVIVGAGLLVSSVASLVTAAGATRLFPIATGVFGGILMAGIPFLTPALH